MDFSVTWTNVLRLQDLITDATTRLDTQMKTVDEVTTDKLIDYGSCLVDLLGFI